MLTISNINSIINPDVVPKNKCRRWTGNKVGLKQVAIAKSLKLHGGGAVVCIIVIL